MNSETEKNTAEIVECQCCYCRSMRGRNTSSTGFKHIAFFDGGELELLGYPPPSALKERDQK